jgi:hypothetical protein
VTPFSAHATLLSLQFNKLLRATARLLGYSYFDITDHLLEPGTSCVADRFLNELNVKDLHLSNGQTSRPYLAELMTAVGGTLCDAGGEVGLPGKKERGKEPA